ncbi:MAG: septum formation initiator family protein [Gemmatimonadota bacterium]
MSRARLFLLVVLGGALTYAIFGGEYTTFDWLNLRRQERAEQARIAELTIVVDSLRSYAKAVATDRKLQERLAREQFGMIRKGEFLYRLQVDSEP